MTHQLFSLRGSFALAAAALIGGCGQMVDPADAVDTTDRPSYVRVGGDAPYRLISVGFDSATYEEMLGHLVGLPSVIDLGPSQSGDREVQIHVDSGAPSMVFESLLGPRSANASIARLDPDFSILLGGGSQAVGLLVPAIQKVRGASLETDGSFVIDMSGIGDVAPIDEPQAAAGGVNVAAGDVNGFIGGNREAAPLGASMVLPLARAATFVSGNAGLDSVRIELARPDGGLPSWFDPTRPTWAAIDIRKHGGPILRRIRIEPAMTQTVGDLTITLAPAKTPYFLEIDDIEGESRDGAAEAAMVTASYPSYLGRSYLVASSAVDRLRSLGPVYGAPSLTNVKTYWQDRAQIVGQLHAAVAHAAEYHGLACQVALPTTLAAAKNLSAKQSLLDSDPAQVLAGTFEALRKIPAPIPGAYAVPLTMSTIAGASAPALVARACEALEGVASFRDGLAFATGTPDAAADKLMRIATISAAPRDLDRLMVEWIALIDSIVAGTAVDVNAALAASGAKADILIEALGNHANASAARWAMVQELVGL